MSTALAGRVESVLGGLPGDERAALERRERTGASYADIATELDIRREQVADLLVGARLRVAEELDGTPPPARVTPQCGPARRVASAQQDGEPVTARDLDRAAQHFAGCEPCRLARRSLQSARLACRGWATAPPPPPKSSVPARPERRRLAVAAGAVLALLLALAIAFGGGDDDALPPAPAAPAVGEGSVDADSVDEISPPGEQFCAPVEPNCETP